MNHLDYRLSKILSHIRIEQARPISKRGLREQSERSNERRLGLSPIAREERESSRRPKAA